MKKGLFCCLALLLIFPYALSAQEPPGDSLKAVPAESQISPGKISLDIKGMDVIDVLKILAMRGNLNIVAGKNVRGRVTLFLKNVEVIDVLEIVLASNGLAYDKRGDIINVMSEKDYELLYGEASSDKKEVRIIRLRFAKAVEMAKALSQVKSKIGKVIIDEGSNTIVLIDASQKLAEMQQVINSMDLQTLSKTFVLNYAKVKDLEETLKSALSPAVGELKIDERMNKAMVTDLPEKVKYIEKIIADFDERDQVVLIEAKIVQITLNKDVGYGINWNDVFAGIDTITQANLAINLSGVTSPTTFTYTRAHGATVYGDQIVLSLLEKLGKTNVLSTPRITVSNNEEAKVLVGTKEAYVTSTITQSDSTTSTADNVQFVNVGVSLSVTPTINQDGYITMKIKPEVSSAPTSLQLTNADGSVRTSVPIVTTAEAETQLIVKDGTTIIMAGLMKDTRKNNMDKIPVLGDIPLLGHFFQSRGKEEAKTELVIFLTPRIIKEGEDASGNEKKYIEEHDRTAKVNLRDEPEAEQPTLDYSGEMYEEPLYAEPLDALDAPEAQTSTTGLTGIMEVAPNNFREYCKYLNEKLRHYLLKNKLKGDDEQELCLSFVLDAEGQLKREPLILSEVDDEMKDIAIKSVIEASPFFPFPEDHREKMEAFRITVSFADNENEE